MKTQCKKCNYYHSINHNEGSCAKFKDFIAHPDQHCGYFKIDDGGTGILEGFKTIRKPMENK